MTVRTHDDIETALGQTELFREVPHKAVRAIAKRASLVSHRAGDVITTEGRSGAGFHLVLDGEAVVDTPTGEVRLGPGAYFGEISLIDGLPRTATVRAATDLVTAVLAPWEFGPLLHEQPEIALGLLRGLCARLRAANAVPMPRAAD
jgi:CRP-like cAMP-binding protein